ncbi:MAG TPA: DEAD/DEAH box helicase, partial [Labilithrix sp.]|nr:DEAD/DEAH box helicase [Labilithrix sp.]
MRNRKALPEEAAPLGRSAVARPGTQGHALDAFHPAVREWFRSALGEPTPAQALSWPHIRAGKTTLLLAPTGSGKTLAAFLSAIDRLARSPEPEPRKRLRVLYVSPLKALAVDVERNLRAPIAG